MAVTSWMYANAFVSMLAGEIDIPSGGMAASLHTNSYTPNQDTDVDGADATNEVAEANGYLQTFDGSSSSGELLGTKVSGSALNVYTFGAADPSWVATGAGFTARILVISDSTPTADADKKLLWWSDFDGDETASGGGTFEYNFAGGDILTITPADTV